MNDFTFSPIKYKLLCNEVLFIAYIAVCRGLQVCVFACRKEQGTYCIPTKARHSLEGSLEADLLQTKVAVPEQTAPEEHPV